MRTCSYKNIGLITFLSPSLTTVIPVETMH